jgi:hypothetical protein
MEMRQITKKEKKVEYDRTWARLHMEQNLNIKIGRLPKETRIKIENQLNSYALSTNHNTTLNTYYNIVVDETIVGGCKIRVDINGVKCLETLYIKPEHRRLGYQRQAMNILAPLIDGVNLFKEEILKYALFCYEKGFTEQATDKMNRTEHFFFRADAIKQLAA